MTIKNIQIDPGLHMLVKIHAAVLGQSIRDYTERALRAQLADSPIAHGQGVLLEPREDYQTQETP